MVLVVTDNPGRTGNLMIRHAHLLAFAREQGHVLIDYTFLKATGDFPALSRNLLCGYPRWPFPRVPALVTRIGFFLFRKLHAALGWQGGSWLGGSIRTRLCAFPEVTRLESAEFREEYAGARVLFLAGYVYRANEAFAKHAEAIRLQLRPWPEVDRRAEEYVAEKRGALGATLVGVHIRHGDYRTYCDGQFFFTADQYAERLRQLSASDPQRRWKFIVCSDEPQPSSAFAGLDVSLHQGSAREDMTVLGKCDYVLGTESTFVRMAAFLGNKPMWQMVDMTAPISLDCFKVQEVVHAVDW